MNLFKLIWIFPFSRLPSVPHPFLYKNRGDRWSFWCLLQGVLCAGGLTPGGSRGRVEGPAPQENMFGGKRMPNAVLLTLAAKGVLGSRPLDVGVGGQGTPWIVSWNMSTPKRWGLMQERKWWRRKGGMEDFFQCLQRGVGRLTPPPPI